MSRSSSPPRRLDAPSSARRSSINTTPGPTNRLARRRALGTATTILQRVIRRFLAARGGEAHANIAAGTTPSAAPQSATGAATSSGGGRSTSDNDVAAPLGAARSPGKVHRGGRAPNGRDAARPAMTILRDGAAASFVSEAAAATENEQPEARIRAAGAERAAAAAAAARASRRIHRGGDRILPRALASNHVAATCTPRVTKKEAPAATMAAKGQHKGRPKSEDIEEDAPPDLAVTKAKQVASSTPRSSTAKVVPTPLKAPANRRRRRRGGSSRLSQQRSRRGRSSALGDRTVKASGSITSGGGGSRPPEASNGGPKRIYSNAKDARKEIFTARIVAHGLGKHDVPLASTKTFELQLSAASRRTSRRRPGRRRYARGSWRTPCNRPPSPRVRRKPRSRARE